MCVLHHLDTTAEWLPCPCHVETFGNVVYHTAAHGGGAGWHICGPRGTAITYGLLRPDRKVAIVVDVLIWVGCYLIWIGRR